MSKLENSQLPEERLRILREPFSSGRRAYRLIFDLGIMLSCFNEKISQRRVMDFGSGSGWIAEWLNLLGYDVSAFDISPDTTRLIRLRTEYDKRINPNTINSICGDGHFMPYHSNTFSHICCFGSLHHMRDYHKVLSEFHRILIPEGRAIFVEPGAKHSTSLATRKFIKKYKKDDPNWIERDVILEEIYHISRGCGFGKMRIRPAVFPDLNDYDLLKWIKFREGDYLLENEYLNLLKVINYDSRVIFYLEKDSSFQLHLNNLFIKPFRKKVKNTIIFLLMRIIYFCNKYI